MNDTPPAVGSGATAHRVSDAELCARFPDVRLDHENKHFYRGLLDRQLLLSRCSQCGRWHPVPRALCPHCWTWTMQPTPVRGDGLVALVTYLHQGPAWPGVDYTTPYPLVAVELDEQPGLRFTSTLVPSAQRAATGDRVALTWLDRAGLPTPAFQLVEAEASDARN